jgi:Heavy metal associated domain 2
MDGVRFVERRKGLGLLMTLPKFILRMVLKPRVVHSLPGRLRVELPALRRIPEESAPLAEAVIGELWYPKAITSLKVTILTGNVLVVYDAEAMTEEDVLRIIQGMVNFTIANWDRFGSVPPDELPGILGRLRDALTREGDGTPILNEEVSIPDDVWP